MNILYQLTFVYIYISIYKSYYLHCEAYPLFFNVLLCALTVLILSLVKPLDWNYRMIKVIRVVREMRSTKTLKYRITIKQKFTFLTNLSDLTKNLEEKIIPTPIPLTIVFQLSCLLVRMERYHVLFIKDLRYLNIWFHVGH